MRLRPTGIFIAMERVALTKVGLGCWHGRAAWGVGAGNTGVQAYIGFLSWVEPYASLEGLAFVVY